MLFKELLRKNGGKLPPDYEGAYEKHLRETGRRLPRNINLIKELEDDIAHVNQVLHIKPQAAAPPSAPEAPAAEEHDETTAKQFFAFIEANAAPPPEETAVHNRFTPFGEEDPEEASMVQCLQDFAHHVKKMAPKPSKQGPSRLTRKQINAIAKDINDGKLKLPDLTLDNDDDYIAVWALLDSGSSVHVVDAAKFFPKAKVNRPKPGSRGFTVASGAKIEDLGTVETPCKTAEGISTSITWRNANVAMPILSTHEIAAKRNSLQYEEDGGTITNLDTRQETKFIQQNGVYFVKLLIPKSITGDYKLSPPQRDEHKLSQGDFGRP